MDVSEEFEVPCGSARETIFIVDDDPSVRESLAVLLQSAGFPTRTYGSGVDVLSNARSLQVGCLLVDIRLPDVDGFTLVDRLIDRGVTVPVIFMTGHDDLARKARSSNAPSFTVLSKPVPDDVLLEKIDWALQRSRAQPAT